MGTAAEDRLSLRDHLSAARWALAFAYQCSPVLLITHIILMLISGLVPGAEVVAVRWLTTSISEGKPLSQLMIPVVVTAILIGLHRGIDDIRATVSWCLNGLIRANLTGDLADVMAGLSPRELADANVTTHARGVREAIRSDVSHHATSFVDSCRAVVIVAGLLVVLWSPPVVASRLLRLVSSPCCQVWI